MIFYQLFDQNSCTYTYLLGSTNSKHAVIIDPVRSNVGQYLHLINSLGLNLVASIDTHLHADHVTGSGLLANLTECKSMMGIETEAKFICVKFRDDEFLNFGNIKIRSIHTPGHTPDSYCFVMEDRVFTGDTLLINATGRTDFQNGSASEQYDSLFNKLLKLPGFMKVYPGHDYNQKQYSTIEWEKKYNPRLQVKSRQKYIEMMDNLNLPFPKNMHFAVPTNLNNGLTELELNSII
ncbi:TPA: MBL fold metallo-hydrolase [Legionella pneumophila]|uniref:MBL fold metallo-hydrolase n=1 Tax=Legionella pneumophila TaxID=446 RepID=UPI000491AA72|nr:MBL fold metallo-hydrolase [Legionella pneumophila]MCW8466741.1 MBL fold metallo-hydrolase [Legionella pneumophila]MCW8488030.1 MBL fold metallo-hydrolase [Legionella pneumophila]MCZ4685582.1 MBL fold metallo-hydrolase [Legionella pneumophila]RYW29969.1 MBL fold metallo-hydrolase [Legionella pneumophila]HAT1866878.1 MBL fold metallo-hydrolase [Legionella pneumophila]